MTTGSVGREDELAKVYSWADKVRSALALRLPTACTCAAVQTQGQPRASERRTQAAVRRQGGEVEAQGEGQGRRAKVGSEPRAPTLHLQASCTRVPAQKCPQPLGAAHAAACVRGTGGWRHKGKGSSAEPGSAPNGVLRPCSARLPAPACSRRRARPAA